MCDLVHNLVTGYSPGDFYTKGIFEYWCHSHIFDLEGNEVVMTDKVDFLPLFGSFRKLLVPIVQLQISLMFMFHYQKSLLIFEK